MLPRDYYRDPIVAAYVFVPRGEGARREVDRVLEAVKEAEATSIWLLVSDAGDDAVGYILDKAAALGLKVTPVLNPYVSIVEHPEVKIVNYDGTTSDDPRYWNIGCFKHPLLMEKAKNLVREFLERYGDHPSLYKIGGLPLFSFVHEAYYRNDVPEFGGGPLKPCCYCRYCVEGFREAMKAKYGSIESFNARHGTRYRDWSEVEPPRDDSRPSLWKEWLDYHAEIIPGFLEELIKYAKSLRPLLATHELNDFYPCTYQCVYSGNDIFRMARALDVGHEDMYPLEFDHRYVIYVYEYIKDLVRSAMGFGKLYTANGQAFNSWMGYRIPPGSVIEQVYSCLIHGSLGLVWWVDWRNLDLWRSTMEANRIYRALVEELEDYELQRAEVALLYSWTSMELKRNDLYYMNNLLFYSLLARSSVPVDVISEQQVLEGILAERGYKLLCVVGCPTLPPEVSSRIREFVENGGTVIVDYAGSGVDEFQQAFPELVASTAATHTAYIVDTNLPWLSDLNGRIIPVGVSGMCENLNASGGRIVARFEDGEPALLVSERGRGRIVKAATMLGYDYTNYPGYYDLAVMFPFVIRWNETVRELVLRVAREAGVRSIASSSNPAVEVGVWRRRDGRRLLLLAVNHLNEHTESTITVQLGGERGFTIHDFFSGERVGAVQKGEELSFKVRLAPFQGRALVIEAEPPLPQ
ncbi:MAG: beta-galactosidase [Thermofilaceae archaeon]